MMMMMMMMMIIIIIIIIIIMEYRSWGMHMANHLHLLERLTVSGAIPPLPILMACNGMTLY